MTRKAPPGSDQAEPSGDPGLKTKPKAGEDLPRVVVATKEDPHGWLADNHLQKTSVWIATYRRNAGHSFVPHDDVLDELIAFGRTDGMTRPSGRRNTCKPPESEHRTQSL